MQSCQYPSGTSIGKINDLMSYENKTVVILLQFAIRSLKAFLLFFHLS
jgi:hypothetical protein